MNIDIHRANSRGEADHGWLHSFHSFSFANYHDPHRMGFGKLRVLNDDTVQASEGFGTHPHDNMEIISIPLSGTLRHQDSMGSKHVIEAGEIQIMSAGTGITHSEFNASDTHSTNFLQIWILPKKIDIKPRYDQKRFDKEDRLNKFQILVSPDGQKGSMVVNQDAWFSLVDLEQGKKINLKPHDPQNGVYLFVINGDINVADERLGKRDAIAISDMDKLEITANADAELLCIETPL